MDSGNSNEGDEAFQDLSPPNHSASLDSELNLTSRVKKTSRGRKCRKLAATVLTCTDPSNFRSFVQQLTGVEAKSPLSPSLVDANSSSHHAQSPTAPYTATGTGPTSSAAATQPKPFRLVRLSGSTQLIPMEIPAAAACEASFHVACDQVATPEPREESKSICGSEVFEQHEARLLQKQDAEASEKSSITFKKPSLIKILTLIEDRKNMNERIYSEEEKETTQLTFDEQSTKHDKEMMMTSESESDEELILDTDIDQKRILGTDDEINSEVKDDLLFCAERDTNACPVQGVNVEVSTEIPKGEEWHAQEIRVTDLSKCLVLPGSPYCPYLVTLSLEGSKALMDIPSSFFDHMPILKHLNLSQTSIRFLPASLFKLVSLKELILRDYKLFFKLSPEVGRLRNLEVLDLDGTEIVDLPKEIKNLSDLKVLRLWLHGCMNFGNQVHQNVLIYPETIRSLSQLIELSIDVNPDDESWNTVVEAVIEEVCSLERLTSLALYLPNIELWEICRTSSTRNYYPLSQFRFTVGPPHKRRIISRVPEKVETQFQGWDRGLKFVKGNVISSEMKSVVRNTKAFYLDRHASARSLCDFGIKNIQNLEFCLVTECSEIVSIIDVGDSSLKMVKDDESNGKYISGSYSDALLNLQYLHIHYLKDLVSIWRTPSNATINLSSLKVLSLHICPKLGDVFSPVLARSLCNLEELIIEDCPEVTCVVSAFTSPTSITSGANFLPFLPKLKRMILLFLPKLVSISSGFQIAPELETLGFYDCPELKRLPAREIVSSDNLKVIKGESEWWDALELDESEWGNRLDHLHSIFSPIDDYDDYLRREMEEI